MFPFGKYNSRNLLFRFEITWKFLKFVCLLELLKVSSLAKYKHLQISSGLCLVIISLNPDVEMTLFCGEISQGWCLNNAHKHGEAQYNINFSLVTRFPCPRR
jgi:hypothetical protein